MTDPQPPGPAAAPDFSPRRIADRAEIQDRIHRFCRAVDRCDWDLAESVYHPDAISRHGFFDGDARAFIAAVRKRHETVLMSFHHIGNIIIDFIGEDSALVESYCMAWQTMSAANGDLGAAAGGGAGAARPTEMLFSSRYVDHFTRRKGAWRIQERLVLCESSLKVTPDIAGPNLSAMMHMGRHGPDDELMAMRTRLLR